MDAPATPPNVVPAPKAQPPDFKLAWPRSAQLTFAFLLGSLLTLLAVHAYGYLRRGTRPSALERGVGITYRVDLNRATRAELLQLPGIGESLAKRIEEYRLEHGRFRQVNDLIEVHGVGPATLERLRPWIQVNTDGRESFTREETDTPRPISKSKNREAAREEGGSARKANQKEASLTSPIDINRATLTELQRLPGVGAKMSQKIVDERDKTPFKSVDDLRRVHGIGPKTLERLRPHVTVNSEPVRLVANEPDTSVADRP
jgi:competence protein ComEA